MISVHVFSFSACAFDNFFRVVMSHPFRFGSFLRFELGRFACTRLALLLLAGLVGFGIMQGLHKHFVRLLLRLFGHHGLWGAGLRATALFFLLVTRVFIDFTRIL